MDTTELYQRMCAGCEEFEFFNQGLNLGDFVYYMKRVWVVSNLFPNEGAVSFSISTFEDGDTITAQLDDCKLVLWLPRFDQLLNYLLANQAKRGFGNADINIKISFDEMGVIQNVFGIDYSSCLNFIAGSPEQYLLKNVMYYCFNKVWDENSFCWKDLSSSKTF